ncbi:ParB/RepB/Spo0J family partition protein [Corynebacterium durum]|jgi:predicted transcriptional regulators|uniref:ParB/RepB/Spo0J family partition protein n=1 Tax=Corynebacterium durum TaxID=61592 RepID=UPI0015CCADBB|nr:ParB/RepB/Spo0J family partition protein [Corynebacterium durum]NYI74621.1 ParB family chromosome partitioning protein [Corynebacterium durum]WJY86337.1 putative chromosome-partitioning protein ParB [Corynebacterium durum]
MAPDKRKGGLGRGLAALIPNGPSTNKPRLGEDAANILMGGSGPLAAATEEPQAVETAETESVPAPTRTQKSAKATKKTTKKAPTKAAKKAASAKNVSDQLAAAHAAVTRPSTRTAGTKLDGASQESREKDKQAPKAATAPSATPRTPATETAQDTKETQKKPNVPQSPEDIGASYQEIPVNQIVPNPHQPRQVFDEEALAELVHSIKEFGLMQPIVVRRAADDSGFEIIMGERRWRAASKAGLETIPAIVRETDDGAMLRDALLENIHRVQLNPLEEAAAYQQLLEEFDVTQAELAQRLGRSRPVITNMIRLLQLPVSVQRKVAAGVLSAGHARALLSLQTGADAQELLAARIVAEGLSVRATEEAVMLANRGEEQKPKKPKDKPAPPAFLTQAADRLADGLDTKVTVTMGKRKGKIVVEFGDREDFERIMSIINSQH